MENISLKQWIVAGILSGAIIGILIFIIVAPMFISTREIGPIMFSHLISTCFDYVFYGIVIGTFLFLIRNKLDNRKLFGCLLVSIGTVIGSLFLWMIVVGFLFPAFHSGSFISYCSPYFIYLLLAEVICSNFLSWIDPSYCSFFLFIPPILIGAVFGFLINYFINRMERKASK